MGNTSKLPLPVIAPRMIGTGQDPCAAFVSVDDPRSAVATDVVECADRAIVAADDDNAFAEIVEALPAARLADVAKVADDLRAGAQESGLLRLEEAGIMIDPAGQPDVGERVGVTTLSS